MTRRYIGKIDIYKRGATMKKVGIHVLDYNGKIIDFISQDDGAILAAEMNVNEDDKTNTFDFTIKNERSENLRKRNKIIVQDQNGVFHEYVIVIVDDTFEKETTIKCNASYLEDLKTAKPIPPGKLEANTTTQALLTTLADTGWEVSDETEYGGNRSTSWTAYTTPYDLINMLCTTYDMVADFYIELGSHEVEHRYVKLSKPNNAFKGKEIEKGVDLTNMTRTIDMSEVVTALIALSPEAEDGSRTTTVIKDDDAQAQFGLPGRYIWDVYEPESNDESMTLERLTTLAKTEMNKRNKASVSYEVSSVDISKFYNDVVINIRDIVRVKDRDFNPPLYIETEVVGVVYDWLDDVSDYKFGTVKEYEEKELRAFFNNKLDEITKKLNDTNSNIDTIVTDTLNDTLEYYERKIFKGDEPPENPKDDALWYDTTNPNVAVLRRYHNGEWINETVSNVKQIGGVTREQALYSELKNSFINLGIQHSKLDNEVGTLLSSEYLVDESIKNDLSQSLYELSNTYSAINSNLNSINEETATIGFLIDTQQLFMTYRQQLHELNRSIKTAQYAIDQRLKLLQSQYTDEKFNEAMTNIANTLPNGQWDANKQILMADIPNKKDVENLKTTLQKYTDGQINDLSSVLGKEIDSKINTSKSEISAKISSVERKIDGIEVGTRNLLLNTKERSDSIINDTHAYITYFLTQPLEVGKEYTITSEVYATSSEQSGKISVRGYFPDNDIIDVPIIDNKIKLTFKAKVPSERILLYKDVAGQSSYELDTTFKNTILVKGNKIGNYVQAPEDLQNEIEVKSTKIAQAQSSAAQTRAQAYADNKITNEEQARIRQADANLQLLQQQQQSLKDEMAAYADNLVNEEERARIDADAAKEEALKAEINLAQTQANAYADNKITAEEERAIADAQSKFEEAKKHAEEKAAQAQSLANEYAKAAQENAKNYTDNKVNNLSVGSRNLLEGSAEIKKDFNDEMSTLKQFFRVDITSAHSKLELGDVVTVSFDVEMEQGNILRVYDTNVNYDFIVGMNTFENIGNKKQRISFTKKLTQANKESDKWILDFYNKGYTDDKYTIGNIKIEKGSIATDWTPAPEDLQRQLQQAQKDAQEAAQAYADAQDELKETNIKAYADGIVSDEEKRAIQDAESKLQEAKTHAEETAEAARKLAEQNASIDAAAKAQEAQENAQAAAEAYAKAQDELKETKIKAYADDKITAEEQRAIADAESKLATAKADAKSKADAAQEAAKSYALTQARKAQTDAEAAAKAYAKAQDELKQTETKAYADGIVSDEEQRAIADAIAKRDEAKEYADQKAQEAQEAANQNTINQLKPITTRVTTNETNITELDSQISLMAKSDDVAQKLRNVDERLTPLETTVKSNKATLDILPTQIDSKVSKQDYTLDKNEIVTRLDNADSQRKQLSNEITDKVTITKFESGMTEAKNYTDNIKEQATTYTDNKVNNLNVGGRNLFENSKNTKKDFNDEMAGLKQFFRVDITSAHSKLELGDVVTVSFDVEMEQGNILRVYDTNENYDFIVGMNTFENIGNKKQRISFTKKLMTANKESDKWLLDFYNKGYTDDKYTISNIKIEKGNVATDWTAAPEDVETLVKKSQQDAEKAAQTYTDAQDNLQFVKAKAYADDKVTAEEQRAIADAESKLETAKAHAEEKAEAARQLAEQNASIDATAKAQKAQENAQTAAKAYAKAQDELKETQLKAYADGIVSDEEKRAIADAESKLQEAKTHAEETSSAAQTAAEEYAVIKANDAETNAKNDATTKANKAEANAKAYTDAYKQNNDVAMTKLETSVSQLNGKVSIKVDEQKFNASQKTLSKVLTEIAATTSGINLTYDNNGTIQGVKVDNGGVKLRGDKVDITVNDAFRVMANRVSNVQTDVSNKVNKDDIINRLNLSPEGLDIDVNKVGIRGGDSTNYIKIQNSGFLSYGDFKRSWAGEVDNAKLELGINNGRVLIRNQTTGYRLYLTERGLSTMMDGFSEDTSGTLEFHSTRFNETSRGITMHSTYGAVAMLSEQSRAIVRSNLTANIESYLYGVYIRPYVNSRPGINEFNFYVKSNDNAGDTDGAILFGEVSDERGLAGSGIRFKKKGLRGETDGDYEPMVYATDNQGNVGTGSFYANKLYGDWTSKNTNLYAAVDNELRVTDKATYNGGSPNYKDLRVNAINTTSSYAFANHSGSDVYFGVGYHELRITANNFWNGGNPSYQNIRFGKWYAMSSEKFKYDIKEWNYSVLDAYRNDLKLYSYKYKSEKDSKYIRNHHGVIIERELPIEWRHGDGFDGNEVMFWNAKAVQELVNKYDNLESDYNDLKKEVEELKALIKKNKK